MNILVLNPGAQVLSYALVSSAAVLHKATITNDYSEFGYRQMLISVQRDLNIRAQLKNSDLTPNGIVIRASYGGTLFDKPVILTEAVITSLYELVPQSPLSAVRVADIASAVKSHYPDTPACVIFETSFFCALPDREISYAVDTKTAESMNLYRFGYNGLFHEAASQCAMRVARSKKKKMHVVSICLEKRIEIAAICDGTARMVTGGATPLEGVPGDSSSGDIDAGILIVLAKEFGWGVEQINKLLTEESGLSGIVGMPTLLPDVFTHPSAVYAAAKKHVLYRMQLACGAAMAAIGQVDMFVFSGRYKELGTAVGDYLVNAFSFQKKTKGILPEVHILPYSIESVCAQVAASVLTDSTKRHQSQPCRENR